MKTDFASKIILLVISAFVSLSIGQEYRRGKYLRTDVREIDRKNVFTVELARDSSLLYCFRFKRQSIVSLQDVRIYETLKEIVRTNSGEGVTEKGAVEYIIVPDKDYEGEISEREEIKDNGVMSNCSFDVSVAGGKSFAIKTDEEGRYIDREQFLLRKFDDMSIKNTALVFSNAEDGVCSLDITRNLLKKEKIANANDLEQDNKYDLLEVMGLNFTQLRVSAIDGLQVNLIKPSEAKEGELIPVTIEVSNNGKKAVSNLVGRTFSAHGELSGALFYFGSIEPGSRLAFTRYLKAPHSKTGHCFVSVGFWSILGKADGLQKNFEISVKNSETKASDEKNVEAKTTKE